MMTSEQSCHEQSVEACAALDAFSQHCAQWLRTTGDDELVIEIDALGARHTTASRALRRTGLRRRLTWVEDGVSARLIAEALALRDVMATPSRGAWTVAYLSMSTRQGELITDFDYDRQPHLTPPHTRADIIEELRRHPRRPAFTPDWLRETTSS
ncbi:hypothetical protein [Actinomyces slackii]|uniref:Uncharacterized protein n=1 Tax=Actinomyces slackii TaxID=52774 RepID=A0A3S5EM29_9ACTO|nr:hypothetical protein [Actinomyces slackii]VEG73849.1 Uncharacterised protein [Actinomyces slackii]